MLSGTIRQTWNECTSPIETNGHSKGVILVFNCGQNGKCWRMIQGWHDKDYVILFDEQAEAPAMADRYGIAACLPDFVLLGIVGWGEFILRDAAGKLLRVPTVPSVREYLQPLGFQLDPARIQTDGRFVNRIQWHIQPIVFGGDPSAEKNVAWLSIDQHVEAVKWWNEKYLKMKGE